ncbi:disease resistance protein RPM1-like [Lolium rigidum]|uniref:disease resistance protein RPM1-like n=1 Tax=Lolium rigidum TaxID=89674 RepID=UPI001F5C70A0|nr:disease resistance protein RPM1-like [Lolium rigidum]
MAESSLVLVITKIGAAAALQASSILANRADAVVAIPNDMILIRNELELMHAFLMDNHRTGVSDQVTETWIGQVRRLAHNMEDIVDQFIYVVGTHHQQESSWLGCVKKVVKKPQSLLTLDEIAIKIQNINRELQRLKLSKDWTQPISGVSDFPAKHYDLQHQAYLPGHDFSIAADELVGLEKNKESLIRSLHMEDCSKLRMISVWGMGGIGKSTLVTNVYREEATSFECHAWISVSQSFELVDIWKQMLKKINVQDKPEYDFEHMSSEELQVKVKEILHKKRYLIILDDVWTSIDLMKIKEVLVDDCMGSRIITTSRSEEVAAIADDGCTLRVEPLDHHDSWRLFCRKAFPKTENHMCPPELHLYGERIVNKCDGLPLALVSIGSILSLRTKNIVEWKLFEDHLIWELHHNENLNHVEKILNLSYKYLPNYLKSCFLYCAIFPEDYAIDADYLIKLWISEGFIEQRGTCSLEVVAEGYLEELIRRNMLHVSARNSFGKIKFLEMHDLVRELAIFCSKKENFSIIYDSSHRVVPAGLISRRIGVHKCNEDLTTRIDVSKARTILCFDSTMPSALWSTVLEHCKYIAVLDLSYIAIEVIPHSVGELFNLKFLNLDVTPVKELPKSIRNLNKLETLSLEDTNCLVLPHGATKLKKLRHFNMWKNLRDSELTFKTYESTEPFEGLWFLKELKTLHSVRASKVLVEKIGNLSQLCSLMINEVKTIHCAQLCSSLSKMVQLQSLTIRAIDENEVLQLEALTLSNPLQTLCLEGKLSEGTLKSPFFSTHGHVLFELSLSWSQFSEDPLPLLSGFLKLTHLDLRRAYIGQKINFAAGWFPDLKVMRLRDLPCVNEICIDEGALGRLEDIIIHKLVELRGFPEQLEYLKYAHFSGLHPDNQQQS